MKQVTNYTESNFEEDYYHLSLNNDNFVQIVLLSNNKLYSSEYNLLWHNLKVTSEKAIERLCNYNFRYDDNFYWIFDYKGDRYYYNNNMRKGSVVGIFCEKIHIDTSQNWTFSPNEHVYQKSIEKCDKMLNFVKKLSKTIHQK